MNFTVKWLVYELPMVEMTTLYTRGCKLWTHLGLYILYIVVELPPNIGAHLFQLDGTRGMFVYKMNDAFWSPDTCPYHIDCSFQLFYLGLFPFFETNPIKNDEKLQRDLLADGTREKRKLFEQFSHLEKGVFS